MVSALAIAWSMHLTSVYGEGEGWNKFGCNLAMTSLISFLCFFSFGMSNTVWIVNTEIYPLHLVGMANSWAAATNWLSNFVVASVFLSLTDSNSGKVSAFLLMAVFVLAAWIFVYRLLPETKGMPFAQNVQNIIQKGPKTASGVLKFNTFEGLDDRREDWADDSDNKYWRCQKGTGKWVVE